jgi:tripartite-type tricarboxylate transporter receptor subunit TctC
MIVAYPPGGPVDVVARSLGRELGEALGQPVVIENKAGGNGIIGTELVARAVPDGYTLLMASTPLAIQETLYKKLPYSALRDFTPVAAVGGGPQVLVVNPNVPANTVQELIALAKAKPGQLNYASPSTGGANHLAGEMLKTMAGIDVMHIPYKGGAPAETDLIGGRVTFMFASLPAALARVRSGQLRALGVTSLERVAAAPDIPTLAESGLPGFEVTSWYGVVGPAGIPNDVVARLNAEINKALSSPGMRDRLSALGVEGTPWTPQQFADFLRRDTSKWAKVIRDSGAKVD